MVGGVSLLRPWEPADKTSRAHAEPSGTVQAQPSSPGGILAPLQVPAAVAVAGTSLAPSRLKGSRKVSEKMTAKGAKQEARTQVAQHERQEVAKGPYLRGLPTAIQGRQRTATCPGPSLAAMRASQREAPSPGQEVDVAAGCSSPPLARSDLGCSCL